MLGLAGGAVWGGALGSRSAAPLKTYGLLEFGLSLYVLLSPWTFAAVLAALHGLASGSQEVLAAVTVYRFVAALALILFPTFLMGATLPVLSQWLAWHSGKGTFRSTTLYSWNTIGATAGVLAGGFWLLPELGLQNTLLVVGSANLAVALVCLMLSLKYHGRRPQTDFWKGRQGSMPGGAHSPGIAVLVGLSIAFVAAGSMATQVIWTRVASLVLGASVYSFTIVLAMFLSGLALGALVSTAFLERRPHRARQMFLGLIWASAVALVGTTYLFPFLPVWAVSLHNVVDLSQGGMSLVGIQLIVAAALLLVPTIIFGALFPAAIRAFARPGGGLSRDVGSLYAWDVFGSVGGVLLAGFLLIPAFGINASIWIAAGAMLIGAFVLEYSRAERSGFVTGGVAIAFSVFAWALLPQWNQQLMASGAHSYAQRFGPHRTPESLSRYLESREELLYYADGLAATITVTLDGRGVLQVYTDGKIDGSSVYDMPTQRLAAHLPLLLHPNPKHIAVIGMGTGVTAGSASLVTGSRVTVVEIEQRMVDAARLFYAHNHGVHERENVHTIVSDGRLHLSTRERAYDVIISVPSNPWLVGSSDLFTADFFARAAGALRPDGIFAQWVQIYGLSPENLRMVLRGFLEAFPEVILATTIKGADILLLGSSSPIFIDMDEVGLRMANPEIAGDLGDARVGIQSPYDLLVRIRAGTGALREFAGVGEFHTDDRPLLAYRAPLDLFRMTRVENEREIGRHSTGIGPMLPVSNWTDQECSRHLSGFVDAYERFLPGGQELGFLKSIVSVECSEAATARRYADPAPS